MKSQKRGQMNKPRGETDNCRNRLLKYCKGQGLDLGCGMSKIKPDAIGIDLLSPLADMKLDARILPYYSSETFDFVYSSHLLEEIEDTKSTLKEWIRLLKKGGYIVLNQADKNIYPPMGSSKCNQSHKHHFDWEELWAVFEDIGDMELIHHNGNFKGDWSFELVVRKKGGNTTEPKIEGISILVPSLNKPLNVQVFSESIEKTTKERSYVEIIFGIREDDTASKEKIDELETKLRISVRYEIIDKYEGNIHFANVWNQLYKKAAYPIIGYFGDGVLSHAGGWDWRVRHDFKQEKNIMVTCNGLNEPFTTVFFTHKTFHDHKDVGFYLNPKFKQWYTDTFWETIFKSAGKLHFIKDLIMENLNPDIFEDRLNETEGSHKEEDEKTWLSIENKNEIKRLISLVKSI